MAEATYTAKAVKADNDDCEQEILAPKYDDEEIEARSEIISQLNKAYHQRQQRYTELDDMTYDEYYVSNAKAANGYIPPKLNAEDVRTVSGVTREKCNTLVSSLLNYNLEPEFEAFDKDDIPQKELGDTFTDLVRKSRKLEIVDYEVKRPLIYSELVSQGTCFVAERWLEFGVPRKKLDNVAFEDILKSKWKEDSQITRRVCDAQLVSGLNVYLGNIREFFLELQPYIGLRRVLTRAEAKSIYGKWARWDNVPAEITKTTEASSNSIPYQNWQMIETETKMVEEIIYMNKWTNTYQVLLNGVCMLPVGFPLEYVAGEIEYPIAKGDVEPISRYFAYSRSIPAKTKFNQALFDEMVVALVVKTRKSYKPPMANNTGKSLSKKIFYPATIHNDIDATKLQQIGDNSGVNQSEFQAIEFVKRIIDESSVSPVFEGNSPGGKQTAREIVELKQQSMMKLGLVVLGAINLEKKMAWLRLNNILKNWTQPIDNEVDDVKGQITDQKVYGSVSMDSEFDDQTSGKRVVQFTDQPLPHPDQIMAEEDVLSKRRGVKVRKVYIHVEELQQNKYTWAVEVTPTEKNTSELRAALFEESVGKAMGLFGPQAMNMEEIKKRWALNQKWDSDKMFAQQPQQMPGQDGVPGIQPPGGSPISDQMQPQQMQKPSLNTLTAA